MEDNSLLEEEERLHDYFKYAMRDILTGANPENITEDMLRPNRFLLSLKRQQEADAKYLAEQNNCNKDE